MAWSPLCSHPSRSWSRMRGGQVRGPSPIVHRHGRSAPVTSRASGTQQSVILAGLAGNVMEWYDFCVYGYFAGIIGHLFFPAGNRVTSLLAAFGVFAAGFLMRPLGSLAFGHLGDKKGRKQALTVSVALMAVPTFLIGLLPTYHTVGVLAPPARADAIAARAIGGRGVCDVLDPSRREITR